MIITNDNFIKDSNKLFADLGDIIIYTITINNNTNTAINNVMLTDLIQNEATFNIDSVFVNGNKLISANPNLGINLNTINNNETITISYSITVDSIPLNGKLEGASYLTYTYTTDNNNPNNKSESLNSNMDIVSIKHGEILQDNAIKVSNKVQVTFGDIINYTITVKNTGNTDLVNVNVLDGIANDISFSPGSVSINNVIFSNEDPNLGINIGNIAINQIYILKFDAIVNQGASPIISNTANISYNYFVDPNNPIISKSIYTNQVNVINLSNELTILIKANRIGAIVGDEISYTITASNTGDVDLSNTIIKLILPPNLIIAGNIFLNGVENSGNILLGINVGTIVVNSQVTLSFNSKIVSSANNYQIMVKSLATYNYSANQQQIFNGLNTSDENIVILYKPSVIIKQSSNKNLVKSGDFLIYTITIYNNGDINIVDGILIDKFPYKLSVEKIAIDDTLVIGNLYTGFNIGRLDKGQTKKINIYVKILGPINGSDLYNNLITGNFQISIDPNFPLVKIIKKAIDFNDVYIVEKIINFNKYIYFSYKSVGSIIEYNFIVQNQLKKSYDNSTLYNVIVSDLLSSELKFLKGSVKIDNLTYPNVNILYGVNLGDLQGGESRSIKFSAKIIDSNILPITNNALIEYKFITNRDLPMQVDVISSNPVSVQSKIIDVQIIKTSNKNQTSINDTVIYTINIINASDIDIINSTLIEDVPSNITLIDGSFKINNKIINSVDFEYGVTLGKILANDTVVINYTVTVNSAIENNEIKSTSTLNYIYKFPDDFTDTSIKKSNDLIIQLI